MNDSAGSAAGDQGPDAQALDLYQPRQNVQGVLSD